MFTDHLSTIAPVKSSFRRHFHAGDHSEDGKSFPCATAGQGKTTASNGLDSLISPGLVISLFFFHFSIPFDAPTKQDDPREHKWKFDNSLLSVSLFFFSLLAFVFEPSCTFAASETSVLVSPPCPSFLFVLIASVPGKGAIVQPLSPLLLFTGLWPLTCDRRGCSGSVFINSESVTLQHFHVCCLCSLIRLSYFAPLFRSSDAKREAYCRCPVMTNVLDAMRVFWCMVRGAGNYDMNKRSLYLAERIIVWFFFFV